MAANFVTNTNRKLDNFYAKFFKIPENASNQLGRQLKEISRPDITFNTSEYRHRGNKFKDKQNTEFEEITCQFFDDEEGFTNAIILLQAFRQRNKHTDAYGNYNNPDTRDYRFDIEIEYMNEKGDITEKWLYQSCFISNISYGENATDDDGDNVINVTIQLDNVRMFFKEDYVRQMEMLEEHTDII